MNKSESIKEIASALCKFQGEVETIRKTETNPFFKSKYADLSAILNVIREPLANNGLSFVQFPQGEYGLSTMLMHTSGEWLEESYKMHPVKEDPQGAGSVITYQRRYALGAILGLNIDVDDDGNSGSNPTSPTNDLPWMNDNQVTNLIGRIKSGENGIELLEKASHAFRISRANKEKINLEIQIQNQIMK